MAGTRVRLACALLIITPLEAACGGGAGVHTQAATVAASGGTSTAAITSTSQTPSTAPLTTATSVATTSPTVTPAAQDATERYMAFYNALNAADRDPVHADLPRLNGFLTGTAVALFDGVISGQAKAGLAYRGTPEDPRVSVSKVISPSFVFLTSCPLASTNNPFVQYKVATGKQVAVATPSVPPPYKRTISMKKTADGAWKVSDLLVDSSRTCTA